MNKETIKNLTALELNCYVCYKPIESFTELRNMFNDGSYTTERELSSLYKSINSKVIYIGHRNEVRLFRHEGCNPLNRVKNEKDL